MLITTKLVMSMYFVNYLNAVAFLDGEGGGGGGDVATGVVGGGIGI